MSDSSEKTEKATPKRMQELIKKGQLGRSQDLTAWLGIAAAALMIPGTITLAAEYGTAQLLTVDRAITEPSGPLAVAALADGFTSIGPIIAPIFVAVVIATLVGSVLQGGVHLRLPAARYEQLNLITGIKRTFGTQALWEGVKALLKTAVVGIALYLVIMDIMPLLMTAGGLSLSALITEAGDGSAALLRAAVAAGILLAIADVFVVMKRNQKQSKMSKKELLDEHKNSDGDPLIKSQRRGRQMAMSRNRMIAAIKDADVVMVNPTHVAVAIAYEPGKSAPRVVAKGSGEIAARIRQEADEQGVPMVRDIPLARALHEACEIGQEIPVELYNAVARVLAFVMALRARGQARGIHTVTTPTATPRR